MRRITILALAVVLALLGAACGGGDDDDASDDTEATDDGGTTDDGGGDDSSDDGDATALADVIDGMGGCTGAAAAVSASMFGGFNPGAAEQVSENKEFFDDFESSVPDDIKEDVELFASYVDAYSDVLSDFDAKDFADPEKAQEISDAYDELADEYPADDLEAASDNISSWFTDECPALAGG